MNRRTSILERWTRFSLRFLLFIVTVAGVGIGVHLRQVNKQRESVKAFTDSVSYTHLTLPTKA